jgi:hypothetical protein
MSGSGPRQAFTALAGLALGLATLQFLLAGLGVFADESFSPHKVVGTALQVISLLILLAAVIGRLGRSGIIFGAGLLVIVVVMGLIAEQDNAVGAFHPLLALLFWFGSFQAFSWGRTGAPLVDSPATAHEH